jgi:hypothetical protein
VFLGSQFASSFRKDTFMTGPAYPAAQAIAPRLRDHFSRHIAAGRDQGFEDLAPEPDAEAIELITDAAFWASLRHEEGYSPKISLAFLPPLQAGPSMIFERPIRLTPGALTRLAPAVERPGIHLGVWRADTAGHLVLQDAGGSETSSAGSADARASAGGSLVVWGATRTIPTYCFVLEVVAPGLLVVKHRTGQGAGKFVNVAVLEGDQIKVLDPQATDFAGSPPLVKALLGIDAPNPAREPLNVLLQLAVSMRAHGRGGSLLVVPAGNDAWRESIVRPISYGVAPPFSELGKLMLENDSQHSDRRRQDALRRAVDAIAGLTAVDGATIISDAYDLHAFGAKITRPDVAAQVERVVSAEPLKGAVARVVAPGELGGTRHISAAQFAQDQHDSIALVASQDGRFTIFAWSPADEMVHAHRVEVLLL